MIVEAKRIQKKREQRAPKLRSSIISCTKRVGRGGSRDKVKMSEGDVGSKYTTQDATGVDGPSPRRPSLLWLTRYRGVESNVNWLKADASVAVAQEVAILFRIKEDGLRSIDRKSMGCVIRPITQRTSFLSARG